MYSLDFRKKALSIKVEDKLSITEVCKRFKLSRDTVFRWTKTLEAKTKRNKPATKIDMEALKRDVEDYPVWNQYERSRRLGVRTSCVRHALKRLGVTYKKKPSASQSRSIKAIYLLSET